MATGKSYLARPSYRFLGGEIENSIKSDSQFEFDEADIWNSSQEDAAGSPPGLKKMMLPSSRISKKSAKWVENGGDHRSAGVGVASSSLPVNIPDWSKILKEDYRDSRRRVNDDDLDDDDENDDGDSRIPPHEFLAKQIARNRVASSFSVHEGFGGTLKGRDLNKVRNAIWAKTGFQD